MVTDRFSYSSKPEPEEPAGYKEPCLLIVGLFLGVLSSALPLVISFWVIAPIPPMIVAGVFALSSRTRLCAVGALAAALAWLVFIATAYLLIALFH